MNDDALTPTDAGTLTDTDAHAEDAATGEPNEAPKRGLCLAELDGMVTDHAEPFTMHNGRVVMLSCLTAVHNDRIVEQVPPYVPSAARNELNGNGDVKAGLRRDIEERIALQQDRQFALKVLCAGRGLDGIRTTKGEAWTEDRDTAWCEAAADELLKTMADSVLTAMHQFARTVDPFGGGDAKFNGTATHAGN